MGTNKYLLSVDPGKTTGLAVIDLLSMCVVETQELLREPCEAFLEKYLEPDDLVFVVAERFKEDKLPAPWSQQMIGVLSYLSRKHGHGEPHLQGPAEAKAFSTDTKLRRLGWWHKGGEGHANDALRHAVLYLSSDPTKLLSVERSAIVGLLLRPVLGDPVDVHLEGGKDKS